MLLNRSRKFLISELGDNDAVMIALDTKKLFTARNKILQKDAAG